MKLENLEISEETERKAQITSDNDNTRELHNVLTHFCKIY
jgi:hypothetical protein